MLLRATVILGTLLSAVESSAFVANPPWSSSGTSCTPQHQQRSTLAQKNTRQQVVAPLQRPRLGFIAAALGDVVNGGDTEVDGKPAIPRLVVMDLDDTLW